MSSKFLNEYMEDNKNLSESDADAMKLKFQRVIGIIYNGILGRRRFPKISRTTIEALFVSVLRNLSHLEETSQSAQKAVFKGIRGHEEFSLARLKEGLSHTVNVQKRLNAAITIGKKV